VNFGLSSSRCGDVGEAREGQVGFRQQSAGLAFAHRDYIAGPALVAGDVYHAAVHGDGTVVHELARTRHLGAKTQTETHVGQRTG